MTKEILLTQGAVALVDDEDYEDLSKYHWHLMKSKGNRLYAKRSTKVGNRTTGVLMHRQILGFPKTDVDHADGNGINNTRLNLRICTEAQNRVNSKRNEDNSSGYRGVSRRRHCKTLPWEAKISVNGKKISLGFYKNLIDAAWAYDDAAILYYREFARTNFPPGVY